MTLKTKFCTKSEGNHRQAVGVFVSFNGKGWQNSKKELKKKELKHKSKNDMSIFKEQSAIQQVVSVVSALNLEKRA